ncbi:hypothetical protein BDA99DRAFT_478753 [Phascolomyces articulosus]|uniref:Uncharacterized protein n=1 Tax=Phascolomyces articulosus TaxID=60185 RepID=A0AAD5KMA4_9FUNG|nr:hypothetical protein BDA99DRAFT_478753 [Phascolomyces articulosus]
MELQGTLYTYYEPDRLTAFESGPINSSNTVVYIGGLTDGYNSVPYLPELQSRLSDIGWSLVQVQLSSSCTGYGISNLQKDSDELDHLVRYLTTKRNKSKILFLGHSTGCQDCYRHNKYGKMSESIMGYVLQAPVSDREVMMKYLEGYEKYLKDAKKMIDEGKGKDLMPRSANETPCTAERFYSLGAVGGDDDVFSTDLSDDMIRQLYEGVNRPMAMVFTKDDECYMSEIPPTQVMERYQSFCPAIRKTCLIEDGGHSLTTKEAQKHISDIVIEFIQELSS